MRAMEGTPYEIHFTVPEGTRPTVLDGLPRQGEVARVVYAEGRDGTLSVWVGKLESDVDVRDWLEQFCARLLPSVSCTFVQESEERAHAIADTAIQSQRVHVSKCGRRWLVVQTTGAWCDEVLAQQLATTGFVHPDAPFASRSVVSESSLPALDVPDDVTVQPLLMLDGLPTLRLERWIGNELVGRISISLSASLGDALRAQLGGWVGEAEIARLEANAGTSLVSPTGTELFATRLSIGPVSFVMSSACPGKNLSPGLWMIHRKWLANLTKQVLA